MGARIQIIVAVIIVLALIVIVDMIRRKALELRYALAWLLVGISVLILDLFPGIMEWLSSFMGIELPINMLFFWGFCFSLVLIFGLTMSMSRMSIRIKNLAQELALYEKREEEKEKRDDNVRIGL